jgi:ATP-grasp N-terminal domain/Carbamoyl-phosphate synthase L chain, ATP binding domain
MSRSHLDNRRKIVFVTPRPAGESLRGARAVGQLDGVALLGITEQLPEASAADVFRDLAVVDDTHDFIQLIDAARKFASRWGPIERIVAVHETLLVPVARASEALGLPGMSESAVHRALDKSNLKQVLQRAGIETAHDRVITTALEARRFVDQVGFPLVMKPLAGSGGLGTWRISTLDQLELALDLLKPSPENAVLLEEHLDGQELCIDTVTIDDEPRFYSLCIYQPTILEALDDPRVQWRCVMPRDMTAERYRNFIEQGLAAVRALAVGNAMTHLEGFLLEGGPICFSDATLRPAGARIGPMLGFAYDMDPYRVWARVAVDGCFDGPWERKHAVGTVFLRGVGQGQVLRVEGLEEVRRRLGDALVDSRVPQIGRSSSHTYTGDGYITVRHPETERVEAFLEFIANTVQIDYSHDEFRSVDGEAVPRRWLQGRDFNRQHCRPAWDDDTLPRVGEA